MDSGLQLSAMLNLMREVVEMDIFHKERLSCKTWQNCHT
jgi:hypothetical protein